MIIKLRLIVKILSERHLAPRGGDTLKREPPQALRVSAVLYEATL